MKRVIVYHHSADIDGIVSGCLAKLGWLKHYPEDNVELIGVNYGEEFTPPDYIPDAVILTDFSFASSVMIELKNRYDSNFIWLDHHISAIDEANKLGYNYIRGLRDITKSATLLTYNWFFGVGDNHLVDLVNIQDLHKKDHSNFKIAIDLNHYLMVYLKDVNFMLKFVDKALNSGAPVIGGISKGALIKKYDQEKAKRTKPCLLSFLIEASTPSFLQEEKRIVNKLDQACYFIPAYNYYNNCLSEVAATNFPDAPFMAMFTYTNKNVIVSLRAIKKECDVSAIAKCFGGGGHAGAAGFRVDFETFGSMVNVLE